MKWLIIALALAVGSPALASEDRLQDVALLTVVNTRMYQALENRVQALEEKMKQLDQSGFLKLEPTASVDCKVDTQDAMRVLEPMPLPIHLKFIRIEDVMNEEGHLKWRKEDLLTAPARCPIIRGEGDARFD